MNRLDNNRKELNLVPAQLLKVEPLLADIKDIVPVKLCLVNKTAHEETCYRLVRSYHYLGYKKMYGPRIKYLAMHCNQPLASLSFNRGTLRVGVRDRYIGWDDGLKNEHLDRVVCNNRFLILPWVKIPNLASHILAGATNPPSFVISFPDVPPLHVFFHYIEAIYIAGITKGYSDGTYRPNDPVAHEQMAAFLAWRLGWPTRIKANSYRN